MKKATVNVYAEDVVCIYANLDNFEGGLAEWKDSIYQLFRYNMTFDFAHRIDVREGRKNGVYVYLVIRPAFQESLMNTMDELGFKNPIVTHEEIGAIECTDLPENMMFDFVEVQY